MSRFKTILALGLAAGLAEASALGQAAPPPEPVFPRVSISGGGASITVEPSGGSLIVGSPAPARPPSPTRRAAPAPVHAIDALPAPRLIPDGYPSQADAARGVAELWAARVSDQSSPPTSVRVYCCDPAIYAAVRDGIVSRLPRARVEKARGDECPDGYHDGEPADGE